MKKDRYRLYLKTLLSFVLSVSSGAVVQAEEDSQIIIENETDTAAEQVNTDTQLFEENYDENSGIIAESSEESSSEEDDEADANADISTNDFEENESPEVSVIETDEENELFTENESDSGEVPADSEIPLTDEKADDEDIETEDNASVDEDTPVIIDDAAEEVWITMDASDLILQEGAFISPSSFEESEEEAINQYNSISGESIPLYEAASFNIKNDFDEVNSRFLNTIQNHETAVYVGDLKIPVSQCLNVFSTVLNRNPQLFYIEHWFNYRTDSTDAYILEYYISYKTEFTEDHIKAFDRRVSSIMSGVNWSWSEEQKALYLHDVLVTETEYDTSFTKYDAYNALVNGSAVCQGYALAYEYLLEQAGVKVDVITSDELNHAWNSVEVKGKSYYVDCTWDDPVGVYNMYCDHINFLMDRNGMEETDHTSYDWANSEGTSVYNSLALNAYPNAYWTNCITKIPGIGNYWFYAENGLIYYHNYADGSDRILSSQLNKYWFTSLDSYGDMVIASQQDRIYLISLDAALTLVGTLNTSEMNQGKIYGIQREGDYVRYDLYDDPMGSKILEGYFSLKNVYNITLSFSKSSFSVNKGNTINLILSLNTNASYIEWKSSNTKVATISNGIVNAVGAGTATITANVGDKTATCKVTVKVPLESISLNKKSMNVAAGKTGTLTVKYNPTDATEDTTVTWTTSKKSVATVSSTGKVTGKKPGKATITAKTAGGLTAKCSVRVLFSDVTNKDDFFYTYVYDLFDQGIVGGYDDGTFRPYAACNRAAVVTFLWRAAKKPEPSKMAKFKDMTGNPDFDKAISWALEEGITTGYEDGTFRPYTTCNRAAIITFLWRYAGKPSVKTTNAFSDLTGNKEFDKAISWGVDKGITTGYSDGTFRPWNTCNRLAIVSFLARYKGL